MNTKANTTLLAAKEFVAELVSEYSAVPAVTSHGTMKHRMEFHRNHPSCADCIIWNWGRKAPDSDEEIIGLEIAGNKVMGYDGVFSLPKEAEELLQSAGFDLSEL